MTATTTTPTTPIPDTSFWKAARKGHQARKGHAMTGYLISTDGGQSFMAAVYTCCAEDGAK